MTFSFQNVKFVKHAQEDGLMIAGEVSNNSGKSYSSVVFVAIVFVKNLPVGNVTFPINGFHVGQTKTFEVRVGELEFSRASEITRYEIYAESAY